MMTHSRNSDQTDQSAAPRLRVRNLPVQAKVRILSQRVAKLEAQLSRLQGSSEVLTIEGLANFLCCSVASAREIPPEELPRRQGPGRALLFLKEDVIRYLKRGERPRRGSVSPEMVRDARAKVIDLKVDSGRRPTRKETDK